MVRCSRLEEYSLHCFHARNVDGAGRSAKASISRDNVMAVRNVDSLWHASVSSRMGEAPIEITVRITMRSWCVWERPGSDPRKAASQRT
jgi:hypothetical protein